jgi:ketosteroid isomerase-like protein
MFRGATPLLAAGVLMLNAAHVAAQSPPSGAPGSPPGGGFQMPPLPRQGFENGAQDPAKYSPEEKAAAAVVEKWIDTINRGDTAGHMALISPNVVFRGDPTEVLRVGPDHYCSTIVGLGPDAKGGSFALEELYVVDAGRSGTAVLIRRQDINGPVGMKGIFGGYPVPVASWLRVQNGKIVEWYDAPTNKVQEMNLSLPVQGRDAPVAPYCTPYAIGSSTENATVGSYTAPPQHSLNYLYGTAKPEYFFNPFEESAAQAVRAFFTAWQPGDVLPLGAFLAQNVTFRADPTATQLSHGRDNLLKRLCGSMEGTRKLRDLYVVGGDFDASVLTRWDQTTTRGSVTHGASFFRVQRGIIVEWYDMPNSGVAAAGSDSVSCRAVDAALGSH